MRPGDELELAEALRGCAGRVFVHGGGTRRIVAAVGQRIETSGLTGVRMYEPGSLTLVAGAGTPVAEVEAVLAGQRQRLAFEVPDLRGLLGRDGVSTLGGVAAVNAAGPRRVQVGACRDQVLGLRYVSGAGVVVKAGGRVMKNVTGLDIGKLLVGSHGRLGVITELAFRVQAVPEAVATLVGACDPGSGLAALRAALLDGPTPALARIVGRDAYRAGVADVLEMLASPNTMLGLGHALLKAVIVTLWPRLKPLYAEVESAGGTLTTRA
jgi:glycolate oxidase FAD binding subunit